MASPESLGWAAALASLGQAAPGIARQYSMDSAADAERARKKNLKVGAESILKGLPQYGSVLESMTPEQAQEVLARTTPEDKQRALALMNGMKMPGAVPEPPMPEGGALGALTKPNPRHQQNAFVNRFMEAVGQLESGGKDIGAHPRAKNGAQAFGRYGVVPEFHAQRVGLDPSKPEDMARFKADPELQRMAAESFIRELGKKYKWDPGMMRRGYYGMPADSSAPQFLADGRRMPSGDEDADKFLQAFGDVERPAGEEAGAPMPAPYDNSLLTDLVKERPKMKTLPKRVSYGDQERYLLSKVKDPEQFGMLKDYIGNISKLAEREREDSKDQRTSFEKEQDRYGDNVRKLTDLNFNTWKEGREQKHRERTYKDQSIQALRAQRESVQKQLQDIRNFQTRVAAGKESPEMLAAAYPDFFSTRSTDPGFLAQIFQGDDAKPGQETAFDTARFTEAIRAMEADIQAIDEALSSKSGASVSPKPAAPSPLSKYLTPRK